MLNGWLHWINSFYNKAKLVIFSLRNENLCPQKTVYVHIKIIHSKQNVETFPLTNE
jgi:hypothetical protein